MSRGQEPKGASARRRATACRVAAKSITGAFSSMKNHGALGKPYFNYFVSVPRGIKVAR